MMKLEDLVGERELSGVDSGIIKREELKDAYDDAETLLFVLDGKTYFVTEDPDDGYRSSMRDIVEVSDSAVANRFAPVRVVGSHVATKKDEFSTETCDILELTDAVTGKVVLEVGTRNTDDYYPYFVANFHPQHMACNQKASD